MIGRGRNVSLVGRIRRSEEREGVWWSCRIFGLVGLGCSYGVDWESDLFCVIVAT